MSDDKKIYKKSNYLIQARYKLTPMEQKVLQLALSKIKEDDDDITKVYTLEVSEFLKRSKKDYGNVYDNIAKAIKRLMNRRLTFVTIEGNLKEFNWVSYAQYFKGDKSKIEIGFDIRLEPYLLQLKKSYTKFNIDVTMQFDSIYTIRIYELLVQYLKFRSRKITISQIKEFLELNAENKPNEEPKPEQYPEYKEFKRTVLSKAIKEINEKTDLEVTFEELSEKDTRKVVAIKFLIKSKNEISMSALPEPVDTNLEKLKEELKDDFIESDIIKIYKESKERYELVKSVYDLLQVYPDVKNNTAFMIYFVRLGEVISKEKLAQYKTIKRDGFEQRNYTKKDFRDLEDRLLSRGIYADPNPPEYDEDDEEKEYDKKI